MELTPEFQKYCADRKINPERLVEQFMADASRSLGSCGSNERDAAAKYVELVEPVVTTDQHELWNKDRKPWPRDPSA